MRTKRNLLLFALAISMNVNLQAQVTIGSADNPKEGAILDLSSGVPGGLVLSNVSLDNLGKIPGDYVFVGISDELDTNPELAGMMVYNTNPTTGEGVYVWNGENWIRLGEECNPITQVKLRATTPSFISASENVSFEVLSDGTEAPVGKTYGWYVNNALFVTDSEASKQLSFNEEGIHSVQVKAKNCYYYPSGPVASNKVIVIVGDIDNYVPAGYSITGTWCYDAREGKSFGVAPYTPESLTQTYTFTYGAGYTDLEYVILEDNAGILQSVSGDRATEATSGSKNFDIVFSADILGKVQANNSPLTAKIAALFKIGADTKIAYWEVKVQDGACCPGVIIPGGVHVHGTETDPGAYVQNTSYRHRKYEYLLGTATFHLLDPPKDLCVYYRDATGGQASVTDGHYTYLWSQISCATDIGVDVADRSMGEGWRLPNIAELGQMNSYDGRSESPKWNKLTEVEGRDPRTENMAASLTYWSSTWYDSGSGSTVYIWNKYAGDNESEYQTTTHSTKSKYRCVRTLD